MAFWNVFASAVERHAHSLDAIEAHYRQSVFVSDVCVLRLDGADREADERLYAVVVPHMELTRERRIANVGDLLRFEIEGLSIQLPDANRVAGYELWFEPLPRTPNGQLCRQEIETRVRRKRANEAAVHEAAARYGWDDPHARTVVEFLRRRAPGAAILPQSNLELDLSLDSIDRVELLADLERRFDVRVPEAHAHEILTVQHLIEAVRPSQAMPSRSVADAVEEQSWSLLLRDLPSETDPALSQLLVRRRLVSMVLLLALRALRMVMPRIEVQGLQHLPPRGPYIIAPNHQSYLDPFFVCSVLPAQTLRQLFFIGASEYFSTTVSAWLARQCNLLAVDPDANLVPAMRAAAFGLTHAKILMLFPEGERSADGTVKRFKKGALILSRHSGVPIIPVAINGVFDVWGRNRSPNWRLLLPGSGHRVHITFGVPMSADPHATAGEMAAVLRDRVQQMREEQTTGDASPARSPRP